ncbi:uncharacterized protein LOC106667066 isoform X2 [Cimex lectularius]|uniref:Fuseless n=1 Tax=Cimex lectularius TaxID=79782 RepID=A0A8I6RPN6_CIMLE|nr:uncharacterized protein LOC106667066 isoform X2 [Cimex lectularius]
MVFTLAALDVVFSLSVLAPLVIMFWKSTWGIFQRYSFIFQPWLQLTVSLIVLIVIAAIKDAFLKLPHKSWKFMIVCRMYIYFRGIINIGIWRCEWDIMDKYFKTDATVICLIAGLIFFVVMNGMMNLNSAPLYIAVDHNPEDVYSFPTMFKIGTENLWMYILDCTYSICVVGTLVVFVWRGAWCLLDMFLYPSQPEMSAWASLGIGYSLVLVSFGLQPAMKYLAKVLTGVWRLIAVDVYLLFSFCGMINVWRGIWNLLNVYFLPDMPHLSNILTHAFSFLLLVLINSSNSILVRGVYVDAQEDGEQCVDFPCYYIRLFFQSRQKKKFLSESEKNLKERRKSEAAETLIQMGAEKTVIVVPNHTDAITNAV